MSWIHDDLIIYTCVYIVLLQCSVWFRHNQNHLLMLQENVRICLYSEGDYLRWLQEKWPTDSYIQIEQTITYRHPAFFYPISHFLLFWPFCQESVIGAICVMLPRFIKIRCEWRFIAALMSRFNMMLLPHNNTMLT